MFKTKSIEKSGNFTITTTPRGCKFIEVDNQEACLDVKAMFTDKENQALFYNLSTHYTVENRSEVIEEAIKQVLEFVYEDHGKDLDVSVYITDWIIDETYVLNAKNGENITVLPDFSEFVKDVAQDLFKAEVIH
jgi:hypothetical protein